MSVALEERPLPRFESVESRSSGLAARHAWVVRGDGPVEPVELMAQVGAASSTLVGEHVERPVVAQSLEHFKLLRSVSPGVAVIATLALEDPRLEAGRWPVSIVVRGATPGSESLVALGEIVFVAASAPSVEQPPEAERPLFASPVRTSFLARGPAGEWLWRGNVLAWVQSSALLSAQGFVGAVLVPEGLEAVTLLGPVEEGERLELECGVVRAVDGEVSVLTELKRALHRVTVLTAVSRFAVARGSGYPSRTTG